MADDSRNDRQDRLKAALRDNLRRRKAQARERAGTAGEGADRAARDDGAEAGRHDGTGASGPRET